MKKNLKLKEVLLITPPFTQLNTPYPATPYLKGFLNTLGIQSFQLDLGLEVILSLFTRKNLKTIFEIANKDNRIKSGNAQRIYNQRFNYEITIDAVIRFLQGNNESLGRLISSDDFLPQGSRFDQLDELDWAFGSIGFFDKAKHLATLYLEDLSDFIIECLDENFGFSRYAEKLGRSANSFDLLDNYLSQNLSFVEELMIEILHKYLVDYQPKLVCFTVPFPGNLTATFRCAQYIKKTFSSIKVAMGGGFANTELRNLKEPKVFNYFDFITLDDGELPLELIIENFLENKNDEFQFLKRTFVCINGEVKFINDSLRIDYKQDQLGTPDYSDLHLDKYISVIEVANPMHSLWSNGRWLKLTMAHGCYWGKCTFCDISLDYIKLYEPIAAKLLVDRMEEMMAQTGETGFHFVDEAAPPALMRAVAIEIMTRNLIVTWWTNIRFEKSFTKDLCRLLKASGCIAVSGGLEVASDRLLKLIDKGVTVNQVAKVTNNFTEAGIMVHAYLMYGYPTQTIQETIDSLEMVRQLFELGLIQSGFWHQFALTAHSPIGLEPSKYGLNTEKQRITFAHNDIQFSDSTGINHEQFSFGLRKSLYNYMHGICFELPLQDWFDFKIPKTKISKSYIIECIENEHNIITKPNSRIIWIGNMPIVSASQKKKKGIIYDNLQLDFYFQNIHEQTIIEEKKATWLLEKLEILHYFNNIKIPYSELKLDFENTFNEDFELFWYSKPLSAVKKCGLLEL